MGNNPEDEGDLLIFRLRVGADLRMLFALE